MSYRLRGTAGRDIEAIYEQGCERFGKRVARLYIERLFEVFERLGEYPRSSPVRSMLDRDVRVQPFASHVILYETVADDVVILRVRHGSEDWQNDAG